MKWTLDGEVDLAYFMYCYIYKVEELGEPSQSEDANVLSAMAKGKLFLESIARHQQESGRSDVRLLFAS